MSGTSSAVDVQSLLEKIDQARSQDLLTDGAVENLRIWLTDDHFASFRSQIAEHVHDQQWQTLDDVFWTIIPFGTGGRRGRMYPIGSNAINDRTIGASAQGLASYVKQTKPDGPWSCAIAYDTRHRSREFAELCAGIMVASGFTVFFIDDYRSTPELSFLVRYKRCDCGIMVTASHNPPSDNAVKVYWSHGGQLVPPHDQGVIDEVMRVTQIESADFETAIDKGEIVFCKDEIDDALLREHVKMSIAGPRDIRVIYSPLHGVGEFNVRTLLVSVGFQNVEIYQPHRQPDGDFPNVPDHVANPENPAVFADIIEHARTIGAHLILATDPDCDRMGAAVPVTTDPQGPWTTLDGNQLGALLGDFVLDARRKQALAGANDYIVTTLVTSLMTKRIAESYGATCHNNNLVGFKWICQMMDDVGPEGFVFGTEESHGYLVGTYARDKDGAVACMLFAELVAQCVHEGISVPEKLDQLYHKHGYHAERLLTIRMEGSDGMRRMQQLMDRFRNDGPPSLGGIPVARSRDYLENETRGADGTVEPLEGPTSNLIIMETEESGNYVAVRPSGTEPKIKMYLFGYVAPEEMSDLETAKSSIAARLEAFERDIQAFAAGP